MDNLLFDIRSVSALTTLSRSHIYRLVAKQRFPAPLKLSAGRVAWRGRDILRWLEAVTEGSANA